MTTTRKVRLQGLLEPEVAKQVMERAEQGRRPVSREVAYLIDLGLAAEKSQQLAS